MSMSGHFNPEKVIDFSIDYYSVLGLEKGCLPNGDTRAERERRFLYPISF